MLDFVVISTREGHILFSHSFGQQANFSREDFLMQVRRCVREPGNDELNFVEDGDQFIVHRKFGAVFLIARAETFTNLMQVHDFLFVFMSALSKYFPGLKWFTIVENPSKVLMVLEQMAPCGQMLETSSLNTLDFHTLLDNACAHV